MKKRILILGLGKFGREFVDRLARSGPEEHAGAVELYALDFSEAAIQKVQDQVHTGAMADLREPGAIQDFLKELQLQPDVAIVSLGDSVEASILATLELLELGVPRILVKGLHESHRHILRKIEEGYDRDSNAPGGSRRIEVLIPEIDAARRLAQTLPSDFIFNSIPVSEDDGILEVRCPEKFKGRTLKELDLRQRFGVTVVGMRAASEGARNRGPLVHLPADKSIPESCSLTIFGSGQALRRFQRHFEKD